MNKRLSFNKIYKLMGCIFSFISVFYISFMFVFDDIYYMKIFSLVYVLFCIIASALFIFVLRRNIVHMYESFDKYVDDIVAGKENIEFKDESDDLISKFQHKLKRVYECLKDNNRKVEKEKLEIQKMISDISHQVKTPMANLKLYNSTLINTEIDDDMEENFLELMNNQLDKLDFLIQSLIKISRLENGVIQINIKDELIYETIASALGNIFASAQAKNINIEVSCDSKLKVKHDPKWTNEALFNILDNAVKYTGVNGKIKIKVTELEVFVKIEISDNGIGINNENICKIFERFYREEDVSNISGIGVGLYLARKIISMEGGYIKVNSEKGKGSRFSVFLLK